MLYPRDFTYHSTNEVKLNPNKSNLTPFQSGDKRLRTFHTVRLAHHYHHQLGLLHHQHSNHNHHDHHSNHQSYRNDEIDKPLANLPNSNLTNKLITQCIDYCTNSSVHGVKYLVDSNLNWFER